MVAQLKGAGREGEIAGVLQQAFWLALLLAIPGVLFLNHPDALLALSDIEPRVEAKARGYLAMLAWECRRHCCIAPSTRFATPLAARAR